MSSRLPAIVIAWSGMCPAAATALAQSPPVRGAASGELRTPSDFSPIELHNSAASAPAPLQNDSLNQPATAAGKTPIRRETDVGVDNHPARTGIGSPWTTLVTLAALLIGVVAATRLLRRWTRGPGDACASHNFDVLAGRRLDAQSHIHLVRIGSRIVAVGSSPAGVQPLTVIDDPLEVEALLSGVASRPFRSAGDVARPLFGGTRTIRRGDELSAARPPVASGGRDLLRTAAVPPREETDA